MFAKIKDLISKGVAVIKLIKAKSYDQAMDAILPIALENETIKPWLAEHKTEIGYALLVLYLAAEQGMVAFPAVAWLPPAVAILGVVLTALGIAHRGSKERRGTVVDGVEALPKEE